MGCKNSCQTYNVTKQETMPSQNNQVLAVTQDLKNFSTEEKERSDNEVKKICKEKNNIEVGKKMKNLVKERMGRIMLKMMKKRKIQVPVIFATKRDQPKDVLKGIQNV